MFGYTVSSGEGVCLYGLGRRRKEVMVALFKVSMCP